MIIRGYPAQRAQAPIERYGVWLKGKSLGHGISGSSGGAGRFAELFAWLGSNGQPRDHVPRMYPQEREGKSNAACRFDARKENMNSAEVCEASVSSSLLDAQRLGGAHLRAIPMRQREAQVTYPRQSRSFWDVSRSKRLKGDADASRVHLCCLKAARGRRGGLSGEIDITRWSWPYQIPPHTEPS
jgi:hypothetical protein